VQKKCFGPSWSFQALSLEAQGGTKGRMKVLGLQLSTLKIGNRTLFVCRGADHNFIMFGSSWSFFRIKLGSLRKVKHDFF